jgi:hypothetical protein
MLLQTGFALGDVLVEPLKRALTNVEENLANRSPQKCVERHNTGLV